MPNTSREALFSFLKRELTYSHIITDATTLEQMYQTYVKQMKAENKVPTSLDTTIFISSGIAVRDEDSDFSPDDVKMEAKNLLGFLIKHSEFNFNTVVVSIGYNPTLHVESIVNMKQAENIPQK